MAEFDEFLRKHGYDPRDDGHVLRLLTQALETLARIESTVALLSSRLTTQNQEFVMAAKVIDKGVADMIAALTAAEALEDRAALFVAHAMDRIAALITPRTDPDTVQQINLLLADYQQHSDALASALTTGEADLSDTTPTTPPDAGSGEVNPPGGTQPTSGNDGGPVTSPGNDGGAIVLDGSNGTDEENADFARGVAAGNAAIAAGNAAETEPSNADKANEAFTDGWRSTGAPFTFQPPAPAEGSTGVSTPTGSPAPTDASGSAGAGSTDTPPADTGTSGATSPPSDTPPAPATSGDGAAPFPDPNQPA